MQSSKFKKGGERDLEKAINEEREDNY